MQSDSQRPYGTACVQPKHIHQDLVLGSLNVVFSFSHFFVWVQVLGSYIVQMCIHAFITYTLEVAAAFVPGDGHADNSAGAATALRVSPFTTASTKLYVGTNNGLILKVENANTNTPTWSFIGTGLPTGSISSIMFGASESELMVTLHNYGVVSIWYSTNGGASWTGKEGDLPDIPVKAIMMNPLNNDEVIIGTQLGVWRTSNFKDAAPKWTQSFDGMSNVKVTSFSLRTADNTVMASTYGRGMFTGQFATGVASVDEVANDSKVFTMYPTVSDGNFTVFAKNTLGKTKLQLFNINGKEVYTKQLDFTQQSKQAVSVNLTPGVYIVNLIDANNKKATSKVIIK